MNQNQKTRLDNMVREGSFRLMTRGDTTFGAAEGYRKRRLMFQGQLTPAGQYLQAERGVPFPRSAIDRTQRTIFRGNSEFAITQDNREVRVRNARGQLTKRGEQLYSNPEITVEVPAWQNGVGRLGEFSLKTTRVYTENEHPHIGEWFRAYDNGRNDIENPGFLNVKRRSRALFEQNNDLLAQESDMVWWYREGGCGRAGCVDVLAMSCLYF